MVASHSVQGKSFRPRRSSVLLLMAAVAFVLPALLPAGAARGAASSAPRPGAWTLLGDAQGLSAATLVHVAGGNDLVVWTAPQASDKLHYNAVELKPAGGMATQPADVFGGQDWGSLTFDPVLLDDGGNPLLVFEGGRGLTGSDPYDRGCIVGDLRSSGTWNLQSWSLSQGCANPDHFGATVTSNGTISAAWPGGWAGGNGVLYRIGVSPAIPASTADQQIPTMVGDTGLIAEATDASSGDVYAAWTRFFSKPASSDGLWVADLTKGSAPVQAPDTGTNLVASFPEPVALASPAGRGGIDLAYCDNASPCSKVELWQYGAKGAVTVPGSSSPRSVALSAGPAGRLWIAWWSSVNGTVRVVRTNAAGTRFGPVATHAGPPGCKGDNNATIRISSGSQGRLDLVVTCTDFSSVKIHASATQSLVPLQLGTTTGSIDHKKGGSVTYVVSDVGDAVAGATVTVAGKKGKTNGNGQVSFRFPKGAKPGSFKVAATMADYLSASTSLRIR